MSIEVKSKIKVSKLDTGTPHRILKFVEEKNKSEMVYKYIILHCNKEKEKEDLKVLFTQNMQKTIGVNKFKDFQLKVNKDNTNCYFIFWDSKPNACIEFTCEYFEAGTTLNKINEAYNNWTALEKGDIEPPKGEIEPPEDEIEPPKNDKESPTKVGESSCKLTDIEEKKEKLDKIVEAKLEKMYSLFYLSDMIRYMSECVTTAVSNILEKKKISGKK